jgi:hypothetical protein
MYNKEDYRSNKESIVKHYEKRGLKDMASYSAMTGIPVVVVYELLQEEYPELEKELSDRIKAINDFFGIK